MQERHLLLKVEQHFSPVKNASSSFGVMGKNDSENTLQVRSSLIKGDRSSAHEVKIVNPDDPEVASPRKKRTETERSISPCRILTRIAKKCLDGCGSKRSSKISSAELFVTADTITKMTDVVKNDVRHTIEAKSLIWSIGTFRLRRRT